MNAPGDGIGFALEPIVSLAPVETLWRRLELSGDISFFVSWTWIGTWLRCLPEHVRPQLLTVSRGGRAIAAAILVARRERRRGMLNVRQLHFNSTGDPALDCIWIEHNGFVGGAEASREIWAPFLRWFACESDADEIVVPRLRNGTVVELPLDVKLLHAMITSPAHYSMLPPGGGLEAILAGLSRNARQQMRRSLRACEVFGELRCEAAESAATALTWFDALKALHISSWLCRGKPHGFRYPFVDKFHRALIERYVPEGPVRLLRISAGHAPIGYLYDFRRNDTIFAYQSGLDDKHSAVRPGYISHLLAMAESADEGATRYDFLAGDNRLKRSLAKGCYAMCSHRFTRPTPGMQMEAAAGVVWRWLMRTRSWLISRRWNGEPRDFMTSEPAIPCQQ